MPYFLGIASASQAQAVWTSKETSRVKILELKVQQLEKQLASQEMRTVRYLASSGPGTTVNDICPGYDNLENKPSINEVGRLMPRLDRWGEPFKDARGNIETEYVYECKIQVLTNKNN